MYNPKRPINFVLASTDHGTMIVNKNDYNLDAKNERYGVGHSLFDQGHWELSAIQDVSKLLTIRRTNQEDNLVIIDCGANVGVHAIHWAKHIWGNGNVYAYEAQPAIFYALAGNTAINNCLNLYPRNQAVGIRKGKIQVPNLDFSKPASYGSLELEQDRIHEDIGQPVDYTNTQEIDMVSIDSLNQRADLIKIDVEGMEQDVLKGAERTINEHHPILMVEIIKSDARTLKQWILDHGYDIYPLGADILCVHQEDPTNTHIESDSRSSVKIS
jgi:FkbM family methyltransferase